MMDHQKVGGGHHLHASLKVGLEIITLLLVLKDGHNSVCEGSWVEGNSNVPLASLDLHAAATYDESWQNLNAVALLVRYEQAACQVPTSTQKLPGSCHTEQGVAVHICWRSQR